MDCLGDTIVKTARPCLVLASLLATASCVSLDKPTAVKACIARADCQDEAKGGRTVTGGGLAMGGVGSATGGSAATGGTLMVGGTTFRTGGASATGGLAAAGGRGSEGGFATASVDPLGSGGTTQAAGGISGETGGAIEPSAGTTAETTPLPGGATAPEGSASASGGAGTTGTSATGGTLSATEDASATGGVTTVVAGGTPATGGSSAQGGTPSAKGGSTAAGGTTASGGTEISPPPAVTLPGTACTTESKDAPCTDSAVCYKFCGPDSQGSKALTCNGSKYGEGACTFSATTSYACYSLAAVALCASSPTAGSSCSLAPCKPCGGSSGTTYYDTGSNAKTGYCVCTGGKWSCASTSAWPCPGKTGC